VLKLKTMDAEKKNIFIKEGIKNKEVRKEYI
jgi:hypothetical protein